MLDKQGNVEQATHEVEPALEVFDRLGATIDARNAKLYIESLKAKSVAVSSADTHPQPETARSLDQSLVSAMDGFLAQRMVDASVSRDLLLHELASVVTEQSRGRGAIVAVILTDEPTEKEPLKVRVAASIGLSETEQAEELKFLSELPRDQYQQHFVYRLTDNQQSSYLLHIVAPAAERYLQGAVSIRPLLHIVEQGLETHVLRTKHRRTQVFDTARVLAQAELPGFICASRAMSHVLEQIHKIRSSDVTVLITGESGTGKELIARAVHSGSSRRMNVFLPFNCSAAPNEMIESQLFGFRRGAFTGAVANSEGIIRAAEHGTLFLDEIGDLPLSLQPKLLRFLQEGEIHPIGESQPQRVDVRVLAATNSELERAVSEGRFREDLFHRINVIRIHV